MPEKDAHGVEMKEEFETYADALWWGLVSSYRHCLSFCWLNGNKPARLNLGVRGMERIGVTFSKV